MVPVAGVVAVVLAAGEGKRMRSPLPKVLHPLGGRAMVLRVLDAVAAAGVQRCVVVVGVQAEAVERALRADGPPGTLELLCARQQRPRGTGDAVAAALPLLGGAQTVLVLPGDAPLLDEHTVRRLLEAHTAAAADCSVLTVRLQEPAGYGRIVRGAGGQVVAIVEERDATAEQRAIREVNSGLLCFRAEALGAVLPLLQPNNAQGELLLTDAVRLLVERGSRVQAVEIDDADSVRGVNDLAALAECETALNRRLVRRWALAGVHFLDPEAVWLHERAALAPGCAVEAGVRLWEASRLGPGCRIGTGSTLQRVQLGASCLVERAWLRGVHAGDGCTFGPGAVLDAGGGSQSRG